MMKKSVLLAVVAGVFMTGAFAQQEEGKHLDKQFIIYKWYEGGVAHYGKAPARGVKNYVMLNEYGMEVVKERPYAKNGDTNIIRPIRADEPPMPSMKGGEVDEVIEGTITKEQRCDTARQNARMLRNKKTVYEEDESGNLVPLSESAMKERLEQAEVQAQELCQ